MRQEKKKLRPANRVDRLTLVVTPVLERTKTPRRELLIGHPQSKINQQQQCRHGRHSEETRRTAPCLGVQGGHVQRQKLHRSKNDQEIEVNGEPMAFAEVHVDTLAPDGIVFHSSSPLAKGTMARKST